MIFNALTPKNIREMRFYVTIVETGNVKSRNYSYLRSAINRSGTYVKVFHLSA